MESLVLVAVVVAAIGAVVWNHRNAAAATEGVEFGRAEAPGVVVGAIRSLYCGGATAAAKKVVSGITVTPSGPASFRVQTRIGDVGRIDVTPGAGSGSVVRAATSELYIGSHPLSHFKSGFFRVAALMTHGVYKLAGIAPNAAKMKRFQAALDGRISRQVRRSASR